MRILICMAVLLGVAAQDATAQFRRPRHPEPERSWWSDEPIRFGIRGGYDFEEDVGSAGAQIRIPLVRQLHLVPSGDVFFSDDGSDTNWQLNADAVLRPDELGGLYAGAGAAFLNRDFERDGDEETEVGYNLLVGLEGGRLFDARLRPFVEARWTDVEDHRPFRLVVGFDVPVS